MGSHCLSLLSHTPAHLGHLGLMLSEPPDTVPGLSSGDYIALLKLPFVYKGISFYIPG